jgi:hypothetical protein
MGPGLATNLVSQSFVRNIAFGGIEDRRICLLDDTDHRVFQAYKAVVENPTEGKTK